MLERIAQAFAAQSYPIEDLAERSQAYRRACRELSSDPDAPRGAAFLGRTVARGLMTAPSLTPGGVVATSILNADEVAGQAGECAQWVARKLAKKEDVQLVLKPEHWRGRLDLAFCHLALGENQEAERLCREVVAGGASPYIIGWGVRELNAVIAAFLDRGAADRLLKLLMDHLDALGFDPYDPPKPGMGVGSK